MSYKVTVTQVIVMSNMNTHVTECRQPDITTTRRHSILLEDKSVTSAAEFSVQLC